MQVLQGEVNVGNAVKDMSHEALGFLRGVFRELPVRCATMDKDMLHRYVSDDVRKHRARQRCRVNRDIIQEFAVGDCVLVA